MTKPVTWRSLRLGRSNFLEDFYETFAFYAVKFRGQFPRLTPQTKG